MKLNEELEKRQIVIQRERERQKNIVKYSKIALDEYKSTKLDINNKISFDLTNIFFTLFFQFYLIRQRQRSLEIIRLCVFKFQIILLFFYFLFLKTFFSIDCHIILTYAHSDFSLFVFKNIIAYNRAVNVLCPNI